MMTKAHYVGISRQVLVLACVCALAACGGGSGPTTGIPPVTPTPSPIPSPTPTPTPAPTPGFDQQPVPSQFNTVEFRQSDGPSFHNAHSAWQQGYTGDGVTIAVIDSGIDTDSPEFAGRLSGLSTDLYASRNSLDGIDDHGTNVALVAAAARDNTGMLGIAWDSTILAIRADEPGSCTAGGPTSSADTCTFLDADIARGVDYAVSNGAKVINISLGGEGGASPELQQSIANATSAGVLVVVAAGNDGFAQLNDYGKQVLANGNGALIIVGSVDENYQISDFSNRAGTDTQFYLAARGESICCVHEDGSIYVDNEGFVYLFSGTSFATPQVAGAAALLAQAFPNLTGKDIAEILLRTAFDAGDMGADAVYGRGILDIYRAFQPLGTTTLAGSANAVTLSALSGTASSAMGDALTRASLPTVITDEFGRAYDRDLAAGLSGAQLRNPLHDALAGERRYLSASSDRASVAFSVDGRGNVGALHLQPGEAEQARVLAARVALQLSPQTQFGFAYAQGSDGLVAQLQGQDRPAFMVAGSSGGDAGLFMGSDVSLAVRQELGGWGLTVSAQSGETYAGVVEQRVAALRGYRARQDVASVGVALDRRFGSLDTALGLTWMSENRTMLGAHFQEGLGLAGADSLFVDMSAGWDFGRDWRLGASLRQGWTRARSGEFVTSGSQLTTRGFAIDLQRRNFLMQGDALALRISQPLRVESGELGLLLPSAWDYSTLTATYERQVLSLSPSGREIDAELAWHGTLLGGQSSLSLFWRKDPGHYAEAPDDAGVALRWSRGF
jgi:hypothetical protein